MSYIDAVREREREERREERDAQLARYQAEIWRLRKLLRDHSIDPGRDNLYGSDL